MAYPIMTESSRVSTILEERTNHDTPLSLGASVRAVTSAPTCIQNTKVEKYPLTYPEAS